MLVELQSISDIRESSIHGGGVNESGITRDKSLYFHIIEFKGKFVPRIYAMRIPASVPDVSEMNFREEEFESDMNVGGLAS